MPGLKAAGKRSNPLNSQTPQLQGYTSARKFMGRRTIKDDFAIARDGHSPIVTGVLSKPIRIDTHCAGNGLMASRPILAAV